MLSSSRIEPERVAEIFRASRESKFVPQGTKSFLVHDLSSMKSRLDAFQKAFPRARHTLAIKANPLVEVLKVAVNRDFGLEAASIEEMALAVAAGCTPDRIVFDSPAKTIEEIDHALCLGVCVNVDNFVELGRVATALNQLTPRAPIGIRINPEVGAGTISQTSVAGVGSKFGVSISQERDAIIDAYRRNAWLNAIHTHVGSQGCGLDLLVEAVSEVEQLRQEIQSVTGRAVSVFNIGGGLPAAYLESDRPPTPQQYAERLRENTPSLFGADVTLVSEFGRSIQANCGVAFSRVETVRTVGKGHSLAVIHLGADFLLRPVYRADDWKHEFLCFDKHGAVLSEAVQPTTLAGPLCFAGDVLGRGLPLPRLKEGDWIAIRDTGAYTLSMWSRHCNRAIPAVLGYDESGVSLLRRAETPDDIVKHWS